MNKLLGNPYFDFSIGFDQLFDNIFSTNKNIQKQQGNYPPYNIVVTEPTELDPLRKWTIELAIAGFSEKDIKVELEGQQLSIFGSIENKKQDRKVQHQGISTRSFIRTFTIEKNIKVLEAKLEHGLLQVFLEESKPDKNIINIPVTFPGPKIQH